MKKQLIFVSAILLLFSSCATMQSIIKSTFPYTATLVVPASSAPGTTLSATSSASSFDQIFGNQNGANYVKEVRVASARVEASNPSGQNLGVFKAIKLYVVNGSGEVMVASREDISPNAGSSVVLDVNSARFVDDYIRGTDVRIRMEYVLRNQFNSDISVRASVNFNSAPNTQ